MTYSKFSIFSGLSRDLAPDAPPRGYSRPGDFAHRYDPNHPRVPGGRGDGGQWTQGRRGDTDIVPSYGDILGGYSNRGSGPTFMAADDTSSMAAAADEPRASVTKIPTDAQSLKQAIDDTARANGTPVFRTGPAMVGILDGHVTRTGENEWTLRDGTLGVFDGERSYGQRYKGFDVIIRQDPLTGAISIDER